MLRPLQISDLIAVTQSTRKSPHSRPGVVRQHRGQQWVTAATWGPQTDTRAGFHSEHKDISLTDLLLLLIDVRVRNMWVFTMCLIVPLIDIQPHGAKSVNLSHLM